MNKIKEKEKKKKSPDFSVIAARMNRRSVRAPSGRKVLDCGDPISALLAGKKEKDMCEAAQTIVEIAPTWNDKTLNLAVEEIKRQGLNSTRTAFRVYSKLNIGMRRMNFGNKLRGCFSRVGVKEQLIKDIVSKILG